MKCRIGAANLKTWSRMITTLTLIGDEELQFEFSDEALKLIVFNASLSVSITCTLFTSFFEGYDVPQGYTKALKLPIRPMMKPFRSMRFINKTASFCEVSFEDDGDSVVILMGCASGAEIRYTVQLCTEGEAVEAECDPDNLANWIRADPKFMIQNLNNFGHGRGLKDLTIKVDGDKVLMKNCATDLLRKENVIYTELCLSTLAFERSSITQDTEVTFQLKDFKTFIAFAEHMRLPITLHFHSPQDPVIVRFKNDEMEAVLLLATKFTEEDDINLNPSTPSSSTMSNRISTATSSSTAFDQGIQGPSPQGPVAASVVTLVLDDEPNNNNVAQTKSKTIPNVPSNRNNVAKETPVVPVVLNRRRPMIDVESRPPPRKKLRELLRRMNSPCDVGRKFPGHDVVIARNSDEED